MQCSLLNFRFCFICLSFISCFFPCFISILSSISFSPAECLSARTCRMTDYSCPGMNRLSYRWRITAWFPYFFTSLQLSPLPLPRFLCAADCTVNSQVLLGAQVHHLSLSTAPLSCPHTPGVYTGIIHDMGKEHRCWLQRKKKEATTHCTCIMYQPPVIDC